MFLPLLDSDSGGRQETGGKRERYDMQQRSPVKTELAIVATIWPCGMCCNHSATKTLLLAFSEDKSSAAQEVMQFMFLDCLVVSISSCSDWLNKENTNLKTLKLNGKHCACMYAYEIRYMKPFIKLKLLKDFIKSN